MDSANLIQKEQGYTEFFNIRRRKKEYNRDKKLLKLPVVKKIFHKTREYTRGESDDIRAISEYIAYDEIGYNKKNFGFNLSMGQIALDGAGDSTAVKAARVAREKAAAALKQKATAAIKKKIFRRVAIRVTTQSLNAILSTIATVLGVIVTLMFLAISVFLWIIGVG